MTPEHPIFADRADAGRRLAAALAGQHISRPIVYAMPRGGVLVAREVALALKTPLDLALVRKIGAPGRPELALAAVIDGDHPRLVVNTDVLRDAGVDQDYLDREAARQLVEIARRRQVFLKGRGGADVRGRTVIIVDDGMATGTTARAVVEGLRARGAAWVILAVPVAPADTAAEMRDQVDELVCLAEPSAFSDMSAFYGDFHQPTDSEVLDVLEEVAAERGLPTAEG